MRVVHYVYKISEAMGGVSRAVYDLMALLATSGLDLTLMTSEWSDFPPGWRARVTDAGADLLVLDAPVQYLGLLPPSAHATAAERIAAADAVHLHGVWRPSGTQISRLASRLGKPYVLTTHGTLDDWSMEWHGMRKRLYYALFEKRTLKNAARVHVTAQGEADQSRPWITHGRVSVIPYAVDLAPFRRLPDVNLFLSENPGVDRRKPKVLFLSRLHPKKGADILLNAIGILRARGLDCELIIAGPPEVPSYVERLHRLARQTVPDAHFLDFVGGREKLALYRSADVMVLPTSQENFGLVITEALACGTPVITTRGTDIWPELEAGGGTLIVERTATAFAEAIAGLLTDRARAREMGRAGRKWVFSWLAPDRLRAAFLKLYRQVVEDTLEQ